MKWIGQHIWDFISRFRSDVYLESVDSGTIASGGNLGLDSNNKIVKAASGSGDLTITNATDNRVVTSTGSTGLNAESTLTYTGENLTQTHVPTGSSIGHLIDTNDSLTTSHTTTGLGVDNQATGVTGDGLTYHGKGISVNVED